uniref:ATP synthase F0 subunit 6 n=1 Tax=Dendroctonus rufipennis TaxID=77170 RepID=UPI00202950F1|nr:ATP synthase F0 subunit 6 [Dendroctonus rufipennis]UQK95003.1 ATP synthase F0 subunit 6 [Dendroctonus rufipennis]
MMNNLFSSFDPSTFSIMSMNWMSSTIMVVLVPPMYWMIPSRWSATWNKVMSTMHQEFKVLAQSSVLKGSTLIFTSLFSFILLNNFLGLFPYIFTSSSHMSMNLTLSLPLWLSFMIYGWFNNTTHMLAHLVPQGAPNALLPFLVLVETISNLIRPGALAVRLTANMIAGHLLLTLLGNSGPSLSIIMLNFLLMAQLLFLMLEFAVAMIQSYVFSVLAVLYSSEV